MSFLCCFSVIKDRSFLVKARRIARVFLYSRSRGRTVTGQFSQLETGSGETTDVHLEFLVLYISRTFCLCFWLMTVKTRAMDFRVVLLGRDGSAECSTHTIGIWLWLRVLIPDNFPSLNLSLPSSRTFPGHHCNCIIVRSTFPQSPLCISKPKPKPSSWFRIDPHILVNLAAEPPAIFWTRNEASSVLSSWSCLSRSVLFLKT